MSRQRRYFSWYFSKMIVPLLIFSSAQLVHALNYVGPQAAGTGNAGRAAVLPTSSHFLNPAAVAHFTSFHMGGGYQRDNNERRGRGDVWAIHAAESSADTLMAGSFSALQYDREIPTFPASKAYDFQLNLAGIPMEGVAVGVGARRLQETTNTGSKFIQNNAVVGILVTPLESLGLAAVAYNVLPVENGTPEYLRLSRTYAGGLNYNFAGSVRLRADAVRQEDANPDQKWQFGGGMENYFLPEFALRLGYMQDERIDQKVYTAGIGWDGPKLRLNYALQIEDGQAGHRHTIDLWMVF